MRFWQTWDQLKLIDCELYRHFPTGPMSDFILGQVLLTRVRAPTAWISPEGQSAINKTETSDFHYPGARRNVRTVLAYPFECSAGVTFTSFIFAPKTMIG